ncbi:MAG: hypothetical protein Q8Q59_14350 [Luteolibacter sp.]|nr:hypothetical protein [Luteolibacter sp.]
MNRNPSSGLTGTSCYRMPWEGGWIELHGAVASWTSLDERDGMIFSRDRGRIGLWNERRPPFPGIEFGAHGSAVERWEAAAPMIRWVAAYEEWVLAQAGPAWRQVCWKHIRRLPRGKSWLPPQATLDWWKSAASITTPHSSDF